MNSSLARYTNSIDIGEIGIRESYSKTQYAFFEPHQTGWEHRICVFSTSRKGTSSINDAERIIDAISKQEGAQKDAIFCDLQTHVGYGSSIERGCYLFEVVQMQASSTPAWIAMECPLVVFETFKHLIGSFLTLDELINPVRDAYASYSPAQLRDEKNWAVEWIGKEEQILEECVEKFKDHLYTPQQAFKMGYRFAPKLYRTDAPKHDSGSILVDLSLSHLLGQGNPIHVLTPLKRPHRFSYWVRNNWHTF